MKTNFTLSRIFLCAFILLFVQSIAKAQVGINTTTPANGAILDVFSPDRGLLIPRVALSDTNDTSTITPSATVGLLVYNTVTAGALPIQVTPGFYYWNGGQWLRFYNRGYGIKFNQGSETIANASNSVYTQISGLDTGVINVPYSGTYHIKVETAYACGDLIDTSFEGVGQASISLNMTTGAGPSVLVKEKYVTSTSKRVDGVTMDNLPQNTTIIYTVDLDVLETYRFNATGREWSTNNVGLGTFGKDTSLYPGASSVNDAQRGSISITLLKQQ